MYAVATFLSPLQSNDLSEPEKKIARDHLKAEVQKLEDYMGEEAIKTNDKIGGVEDHKEVYIPGAGHLGKLNNRDLRRLNQEADFDTRYIMLSSFSFTIFSSNYRFGKDLERYKKDSVEALAKLQASREKQKPCDPVECWIMVHCLCSTKLAYVACDSKFNKY